MALHDFIEEVQVLGRDLVDKVKALIHEGNVQRIIVKDEHGNTFIEIPVTERDHWSYLSMPSTKLVNTTRPPRSTGFPQSCNPTAA